VSEPIVGDVRDLPRPHPRRRTALIIALAADLVQWIALPLFVPGLPSIWDTALDVIVAAVMIRLVGWHPAFLPAGVAELVPGLDLFPSWTGAVWFATRKKKRPPVATALP
jgi:hypothetical protein